MLDINFDKQPEGAESKKDFSYRAHKDNVADSSREAFIGSFDASHQYNLLVIASFLAIILTIITGLLISFLTDRTNQKASTIGNNISTLEARFQNGDLAPALSKVEAAARKINKYKVDTGEIILWNEILTHLSNVMPTTLIVNELTLDAKEQLVLRGEAKRFDELAIFLAALENDELFFGTKLKNAAFSDRLTNQFVDFSLTSNYKRIKQKDKAK